MNNRPVGRLPLRISVEVHKERRLLGNFITRDIDQAGVFVEAAEVDVYPNEILSLVFNKSKQVSCIFKSRAIVMRREVDGIGLMFIEGDNVEMAAFLSDCRDS